MESELDMEIRFPQKKMHKKENPHKKYGFPSSFLENIPC